MDMNPCKSSKKNGYAQLFIRLFQKYEVKKIKLQFLSQQLRLRESYLSDGYKKPPV